MIFILGGLALGTVTGGVIAKGRGGKPADMAQYAVAYAIAFGLIGVIVTIALDRYLLA
jgi:hypothetical protein